MFGQIRKWLNTRPKPRFSFSLGRLIGSVTFVSLGIGALILAGREEFALPVRFLCAIAALPLLLAGICTPFKLATEGAMVSIILSVALTILILVLMRYADV